MNDLIISRTGEFEVTGGGDAAAWQKADWCELSTVKETTGAYRTRAKVLYSETGLYFLFDCEDQRLTCTGLADFDDLFNEDVVEVFLQPDPAHSVYFEYEISPLGAELPLLVPNHQGTFHGWLPWHYERERKVRRATKIRAGETAAMAACEGWTAEFFIPFTLLTGLGAMPPAPGTRWRGNLYRIDYDGAFPVYWSRFPLKECKFHRFAEFGWMQFA